MGEVPMKARKLKKAVCNSTSVRGPTEWAVQVVCDEKQKTLVAKHDEKRYLKDLTVYVQETLK
jgi:hypothetical protein